MRPDGIPARLRPEDGKPVIWMPSSRNIRRSRFLLLVECTPVRSSVLVASCRTRVATRGERKRIAIRVIASGANDNGGRMGAAVRHERTWYPRDRATP